MRLLLASLLLGCTGEQVTSVPTDSGAGDAAACAPAPNNPIDNASFETVVSGVMPGWNDPVEQLFQRKGGAAHCESWAEVHLAAASTAMSVMFFGQDFRIEPTPKKGQKLIATLYVKTLDENSDAELSMGVVSGENAPKAIKLTKDWKQFSHEFPATGEDVRYYISVASTLKMPRKLGIDHVVVTVTP